jgi:hypothetical protein
MLYAHTEILSLSSHEKLKPASQPTHSHLLYVSGARRTLSAGRPKNILKVDLKLMNSGDMSPAQVHVCQGLMRLFD